MVGSVTATSTVAIAPEERSRAEFYDFLSRLLSRPPSADLLQRVTMLEGDDSVLGQEINTLADAARKTDANRVRIEYNALFIGLGRGELVPYGSFYMTGFLNEKPLATLRRDMARLQVARVETVHEPEDNIASLLEIMAGLILGRFSAPAPLDVQRRFFNTHLAPWAGHFFRDLDRAEGSDFYAPVGRLGQELIAIETEAFRMEAGTAG